MRHNLFKDQLGMLFAFTVISWRMYPAESMRDTVFIFGYIFGCARVRGLRRRWRKSKTYKKKKAIVAFRDCRGHRDGVAS